MLPNWLYGKSKSKLASILGGGGGTTYTAGAGIKISDSGVISLKGPYTATLAAGETEVEIIVPGMTSISTVLPLVSVWGVVPKSIVPTTDSVTLTFEAQQTNITVAVYVLS